MTRERFRFGAVLFGLIAQIVGGVLVFGFTPQIIFADIGGDDLARLYLRLAVYSNMSMAVIVALILLMPGKLACCAGWQLEAHSTICLRG